MHKLRLNLPLIAMPETNLHQEPRAFLLAVAQGETASVQQMLDAIASLEKRRFVPSELQNLQGEWQLIWTSGTRSIANYNQSNLDSAIKRPPMPVFQRFDFAQNQIENEVRFSVGNLCVTGKIEPQKSQRLQFVFTSISFQIGRLPTIKLPFGNWAKGWLQTTYIDEQLHLERGDRGGVSVWMKS